MVIRTYVRCDEYGNWYSGVEQIVEDQATGQYIKVEHFQAIKEELVICS